jgi:transcriptional regulator with XRE-family HTH domain
MTLKELERQANVCLSTISRIETGRSKKIDIYELVSLTKALNVSVDTLIIIAEKIDTKEIADVEQKLMQAQTQVRCFHDQAAQELKALIENFK